MIGEHVQDTGKWVVCGQCRGWFDPSIGCPCCDHGFEWREESHHVEIDWDHRITEHGFHSWVYR